MTDIRPFLRLLSADELTALRDKVKADLLSNVRLTTLSMAGKASGQEQHVNTAELASQLAEVLEEKGLVPEDFQSTPRMTVARFE